MTSKAHRDLKARGIEHLLSALAGMHIDNALILLRGESIPDLSSGSVVNYASLLDRAGTEELEDDVDPVILTKENNFHHNES